MVRAGSSIAGVPSTGSKGVISGDFFTTETRRSRRFTEDFLFFVLRAAGIWDIEAAVRPPRSPWLRGEETLLVERRTLLASSALGLLLPVIEGCGAAGPPPGSKDPPLPPLATSPLASLVAAASVRWVILAAPRELLGTPWVPALVDVAVSGARFERFAQVTGIDLRTLPEAVVASCLPASKPQNTAPADSAPPPPKEAVPPAPDGSGQAVADPLNTVPSATPAAEDDEVMLYLARHTGDAQAIERAYRARFTSGEKRSVERPDLVRISGKVGRRLSAAAFLGKDVAAFQDGGSASRGPVRVASLFAEGKLKHARPVMASEPLHTLALKLGAAPLAGFAPGPFEGDLARGLRGLLAGATGIGAVLRPTERQSFVVTAAVAGDFTTSATPAADELLAAWKDLAQSRLGHILGLDKPVSAPMTSGAADAVMISVELSARALAEGLAVATASKVQDIFK